jgi:hypothetical protein
MYDYEDLGAWFARTAGILGISWAWIWSLDFRLSLFSIPTYEYVCVVKSRTISLYYFERVPENLPCAIASMSMSAMFETLLQG